MSNGLSFGNDQWAAKKFAESEEMKGGVRAEVVKEGIIWKVYLYDVMSGEEIEGSKGVYEQIMDIGEERKSTREQHRLSAKKRQEQIEAELKKQQDLEARKTELETKKKEEEYKKKWQERRKKAIGVAEETLRDTGQDIANTTKTMGRYGNVKKDLSRSVPTTSGKHPRILQDYSKTRIASAPQPKISQPERLGSGIHLNIDNIYPYGVPHSRRKNQEEQFNEETEE